MSDTIAVSGLDTGNLSETLESSCRQIEPTAVGIASAFISVSGVENARKIFRNSRGIECRMVAGLDHALTHPEALSIARDAQWEVRVLRGLRGIFHAKIIIAGEEFVRSGTLRTTKLAYVGSSNLTDGGLHTNIECGLIAVSPQLTREVGEAFSQFWQNAMPISDTILRSYAAEFAARNRSRSPHDLHALGIATTVVRRSWSRGRLLKERPPSRSIVANEYAAAAWTGLQSFTGEYRFQIEFPRAAGEVVMRLVANRELANGVIEVFSAGDGKTYPLQYRYYPDNGMFRLNVPNDVTGVQWAREHRDGLALIEVGPKRRDPIRLSIHRPGIRANEIVARSVALGSWGRTSTRLYGWY